MKRKLHGQLCWIVTDDFLRIAMRRNRTLLSTLHTWVILGKTAKRKRNIDHWFVLPTMDYWFLVGKGRIEDQIGGVAAHSSPHTRNTDGFHVLNLLSQTTQHPTLSLT
ncbi:hypothetical protein FOPG_19034 [Fusarium oxysporum f. sp. conglutinans race 2 54008]|uniref:Uncharacterized protein n=1 Tax=Fusarium oxysporum f. sp. conglutinans race 2 54008 TaxID=1089457 RepID=X0GXZ7_FUSOX|nr:hypothetical protein FOPG_19034 [Fusarium oxysporum f. sp. conglutinans race 2 54008]